MKIKLDFVTNSSSTSYLFIFKGNCLNDLFTLMKNNWKYFEIISYNNDEVQNVYNIIEYMQSNSVHEKPITDKIEEIEKEIYNNKKYLKEEKEKNKYAENFYEYIEKLIQKKQEILELLKFKKKTGYNFIVDAEFSDEDGQAAGIAMRYNKISIDKEKLKVISSPGE